jgi:hypothetical protein
MILFIWVCLPLKRSEVIREEKSAGLKAVKIIILLVHAFQAEGP